MREAGTIAAIGMGCCTGVQFQRTGGRHNQDIAQVGMPRAAEVRMTETDDAAILILIAGAILVGAGLVFPVDVVRDGVRIRTELDQSEGNAGPGKGMSHPVSPDDGIDSINHARLRDREGRAGCHQ